MKLRISDELGLPIEAVTEVLAFLGRRGQGKSYAAQRLAELFHEAGAQFVVLDPVGNWYGLRLAADGKAPGIPIPVFGGLQGDVPLEPTAGRLVADLVVDRGVSVVLDVSQFESDAARARFVKDFGDRFFTRRKQAPAAVHLFIEEAQEFIPQNPMGDEKGTLHVLQRIAKLGRNYGIGVSLLSQRPQEVHKKVLNLAELLFAFQLSGTHERKAVAEWIRDKAIDEDIDQELPRLARGHPHAWSPAWLKVSEVVAITPKWTFDASSTPRVGKTVGPARPLSPIDLDQLRTDMAATIERAKQEDPKALRQQLAERDRRIRELEVRKPVQITQAEPVRVEVPVLTGKQVQAFERGTARLEKVGAQLVEVGGQVVTVARELVEAAKQAAGGNGNAQDRVYRYPALRSPIATAPVPRPLAPPRRVKPEASSFTPAEGLSAMQRRMLTALAQHPDGLTKAQILLHTGYASSGPVSTAFAEITRSGWAVGDRSRLSITDDGLRALGPFDPLPTGSALREYLLESDAKLGQMERALLRAVADSYPEAISKGDILERTGYASSGPVSSAFARLVRYGYVRPDGRSLLRAAEELFG